MYLNKNNKMTTDSLLGGNEEVEVLLEKENYVGVLINKAIRYDTPVSDLESVIDSWDKYKRTYDTLNDVDSYEQRLDFLSIIIDTLHILIIENQ